MRNVPPNTLALSHRQSLVEKLSTSLQKRRLWLRDLCGARSRTVKCRYFDAQFIVDLDDVIGYEIAIRRFEWRELKLMIDACRRLAPVIFLDVGANISMSTPGQPTENAFAESFIKTLKWEEVYLRQYQTFEEAQARLQTFLEDVYNAKRLHSSLDSVPPDEFELKYTMC